MARIARVSVFVLLACALGCSKRDSSRNSIRDAQYVECPSALRAGFESDRGTKGGGYDFPAPYEVYGRCVLS
jgi:hypothetical protein